MHSMRLIAVVGLTVFGMASLAAAAPNADSNVESVTPMDTTASPGASAAPRAGADVPLNSHFQ